MKKLLSAAAMLAASASPLFAQSIVGATIQGNYNSFDNSDGTTLQGSGEFALSPTFGIGGGLLSYSNDDVSGTSVTLRGLYFTSPQSALGVFYARSDEDDTAYDTIGVEWGQSSEAGRFEVYYGSVSSDDIPSEVDLSIAGLSGEFRVADNVYIRASSEAWFISNDPLEVTYSTSSIGARYLFDQGIAVYADFGSFGVTVDDGFSSGSGSEEFVGIGVEYNFGSTNGAMLSTRTLSNAIGF